MQPCGANNPGTPSRRGPFTFRVTIQTIPVCPMCGDVLNPEAVAIRGNILFCASCTKAPPNFQLAIAESLIGDVMAPHLTHAKGIVFYTPRTIRPISAYQHRMQIDGGRQPDLPYQPPPTTAGGDVDADSHESATQRDQDPLRS